MSFGKDLWDQVAIIETYADHGVQFMEKINDFMKQVSTIHAEEARSILKVVKQHKDEIARKSNDKTNATFNKAVLGSTLAQSWQLILTETETTANYKLEICDKIDTEIRKNIKHQGKDNEKMNKQRFDDIRKANVELKKVVDNLEKMQQRYEKTMKDMDMAKTTFENAEKDQNSTKKLIDQLKAEVDKKVVAAHDAGSAYQQCMIQSNVVKNQHFTEILPSILDNIQTADDENKTAFCKSSLQGYVDLNTSVMPKIEKSYQLMTDAVSNINSTSDMDMFIKCFKTNDPYPEDFQMSDTQEIENGKKTFMRGMSKSREDRLEDQIEDQIVSLPAKQGRKKAVDRVKVHEKEIADVEKKRQGVHRLFLAYKEKPTSGSDTKIIDDLVCQKTLLEKRIDTLMLKKYKLLTYISTIDGVSPPELPIPARDRVITTSPLSMASISSPSDRDLTGRSPLENSVSPSKISIQSPLSVPIMPSQPSLGTPVSGKFLGGPSIGQVTVMFEFEAAAGSQEMSIKAGQVLDVIEKQDDGWWRCRHGDQEGYVPGNYTEPV
ncbi:hypothetical protein BASA61_008196 [Batrachochytrium salamandrivorans]|nr:hypothetical protein BASA61_008196 [Batrachochytrium salamandrivorans]